MALSNPNLATCQEQLVDDPPFLLKHEVLNVPAIPGLQALYTECPVVGNDLLTRSSNIRPMTSSG